MSEKLKAIVKEKYTIIANQAKDPKESSSCGASSCCSELEISMIGNEYQNIEGYDKNPDLGLGCGLPTVFAEIKAGDSVLDLGSGAGNDCFVVRAIVGETGKVTGLNFPEEMILKA